MSGFLLAGITVIATFLRLHAIDAKPIWFDEGLSFGVARLPWRQLFQALWNRDANMGLYFLLLHVWLSLGSTLGFLRGLSVVFSVATVPVIYALGARLFGRNAGLLAAWLLALNAFHIRYAQEIRGYSMVAFFATLATWLLVRNLQEPASARWGMYSAACALTIYSHFMGGTVILVHFLSLAYLRFKDVPVRDLVRSYFWFACSMIPIVLFSLRMRTGTVDWIPPTQPRAFLIFWEILGGNYGLPLLALEACAIGIVMFGAIRMREEGDRSPHGWGYALVLAWLFVPVLLVLTVSIVHPLFVARYLIPCLPALMLGVAAGIVNLKSFALSSAVFALISVLSVLGTFSYYQNDIDIVRGDWEAVNTYIFDHALPGDGVFFYDASGQYLFKFYESQRNPMPVTPEILNPQTQEDKQLIENPSEVPSIPELEGARPAPDRVWLVLFLPVNPDGMPDTKGAVIRDWFAKGRRRIDVQSFTHIGVLLFARDHADPSQARGLIR